MLQAGITFPTEDRLCTEFGINEARKQARSNAFSGGGGSSSGGSSFGRGRGGRGALKPAFASGSGFSGGPAGGRGFAGRGGGGGYDQHREDTWEALLVLAAVADAFDDR